MQDRFDGMVTQLLDAGFFLEQAIEIVEKGMIQGALERNGGNQCAAARLLGIHRNTLQRKMVEYHLDSQRRKLRKPAGRAGQTRKKRNAVA